MKNPFVKQNNNALIAGLVLGTAAAAGTAAYLFLTEEGGSIRRSISESITQLRKTFMPQEPEQDIADEHATDYMHPKMKAPKTDREALLHHEIIHE